MKIEDKIKTLLEEKGWKLTTLNKKIEELFEEHAIDYRTLLRTIHSQTKLRESTLFQIATALGIAPEEIRKGTEEETKLTRFDYNNKAYLETESNNLDFLVGRLVLLPQAKTETLQDPEGKGKFIKYLFGLQGESTCVVTTEKGVSKHKIRKNQTFFFQSTCPHHFENSADQKAVCLLIHNPKYI